MYVPGSILIHTIGREHISSSWRYSCIANIVEAHVSPHHLPSPYLDKNGTFVPVQVALSFPVQFKKKEAYIKPSTKSVLTICSDVWFDVILSVRPHSTHHDVADNIRAPCHRRGKGRMTLSDSMAFEHPEGSRPVCYQS